MVNFVAAAMPAFLRRAIGRRIASGTDPRPWAVSARHLQWQDRAACIGADPESFFHEGVRVDHVTRRMCGQCPVMRTCGQYALDHPELDGYWGGTTKHDRDQIRRSSPG